MSVLQAVRHECGRSRIFQYAKKCNVSICKHLYAASVEISASETSTEKVTWASIHGRDTGMKIELDCQNRGTVCGLDLINLLMLSLNCMLLNIVT